MKKEFKFLIPAGAVSENSEDTAGFQLITPADNIPFVKTIAECLQAERNGLEGVIWDAEDYDQLEELIPKKAAYGWMLVSINIPVYFHLTDLDQLSALNNVEISGFYSEDQQILKDSRKKVETLFSE